jgi:DNA-binding NarL/FixJ family response regulator
VASRKPPKPRGAPRRADAESGPKITTLLVDDHKMIRQGVRALLKAEDDIVVVGEAQDGREAVAMVKKLRPDVVVMDVAMPMLNGIEATRQILVAAPKTRVIVLSAHSDDEFVASVMELGAAGYLLKQSTLESLAAAIRAAKAGGAFFGPGFTPGGRVPGTPDASRTPPTPAPPWLTAREAEVLQLIAEGRANAESAAELRISVKTVEKHRQSLMTKLDIHDVAGLTRYAVAIGSIEGRDRGAAS